MNDTAARPYRVMQLGPPDERNVQRNIPVTHLESLVTRHPRASASASLVDGIPDGAENAMSRSYAVIGGEFQEVQAQRTDRKYRSLDPDQILIIKDFILDDTAVPDSRRVDVPSPLAGVIGRVDPANGVVDVHATADGPLVARIRHLGPIAVAVGDAVAYGQSLGTQNNIGLGPGAGKHVHIEMDTRHYQALDHSRRRLFDRIRGQLEGADAGLPAALEGCERERVACALLRLAVDERVERVDHVLVGEARPGLPPQLFLVQGRLDDPAHRRVSVPLAEACVTPIEPSLAGLGGVGVGGVTEAPGMHPARTWNDPVPAPPGPRAAPAFPPGC